MNLISGLKEYSLGIVAANKELGSKVIEVTPIEVLPFLDGEINDHGVESNMAGKDADNKDFSVNVKTSSTIPATWLPYTTTNRQTAPDVRRGEIVQIFRYADTDKYYWTTIYESINLRRLETVVWAFSGNAEEDTEPNSENTYYVEVSTHRGVIHIRTSDKNGEYTTYDIQLNTKDGCFILQDGKQNTASLDSTENRFELITASQSHFDLHDKDLTITIPGNTKIITTGNTEVETTGNTTITTKGDTTIKTFGKNLIEGVANIIKGNTTIMGTLNFMGLTGGKTQGTLKGDFRLEGNMEQVEGSFRTSGNVEAAGTVSGSYGNFPNLD